MASPISQVYRSPRKLRPLTRIETARACDGNLFYFLFFSSFSLVLSLYHALDLSFFIFFLFFFSVRFSPFSLALISIVAFVRLHPLSFEKIQFVSPNATSKTLDIRLQPAVSVDTTRLHLRAHRIINSLGIFIIIIIIFHLLFYFQTFNKQNLIRFIIFLEIFFFLYFIILFLFYD